MRWSALYAPTLRDDPAEAEAPSHRLLVRAGFIRQLAAGHYTLMPLAMRVRERVIGVIREEMNRIGGQEFMLPAMHPADVWKRSGRYDVDVMFRLTDRKGNDNVLGLTHEEIFATIAAELHSYKQLPQVWYQFQTKFRDEARPKSGLLRVREFTMKDAYSFDVAEEGLDVAFEAQRGAYERIFARLGVPAIAVDASSGAMGGSASVEFMCPSDAGEDLVVRCGSCGYAANVEKATSCLGAVADAEVVGAPEPFDTPGVRTIDDLVTGYGVAADRQLKTLVYIVDGEATLVVVRGDHALVEQKLVDATGAAAVRPAHEEEIVAALGARPGSLGAVGVDLPVIADEAVRGRRGMTTGANRDGVHVREVDVERDIAVGRWADLREVVAGEPCVRCGESLDVVRCIEVGHIFKLGRRYTEAFGVTVLDGNGRAVTPIMGSYGIGVERAIAAIVESHHDDAGIVWPVATAPFAVDVVAIGAEAAPVAEDLYSSLLGAGVDVILDDRNERPGVKFTDAELVGVPVRVTLSRRGVAAGTAEITVRSTRETVEVPIEGLSEAVRETLARLT